MKKAAEGTEAQLISGLHNHEYSSIMDYSGKIFGDWAGIGKYDEAALIFAYSGDTQPGYVEVFDNARKTSKVIPGSDGANVTISGAGADLPDGQRHPHQPQRPQLHRALPLLDGAPALR